MIVPAVKFPEASRATIALAVLLLVAVVAEFETLPAVEMVSSLVSTIPAVALMSPLVIVPSAIIVLVTVPESALVMMFPYTVPSLVKSHLSAVSFQRTRTFAESPRSISIPAETLGVPVTFEFRTTTLSSILMLFVLNVVVVPLTVRSPPIVTFPVV